MTVRTPHFWRLPAGMLLIGTLFAGCNLENLEAAGLLVADGGLGGQPEIKEHTVRVVINNGVAVTEVEQIFVNKEQRPVEALYTFPVPKRASVSGFSMCIGGKEMVGEVVEKARARQIYESYKQVKRDPGLLEQVDFKRFEMRIFPIPAGAEQRVKLTYYQELDFDHDTATYVYPLATTAVPGTSASRAGKFAFSLEAKSEIPIVEMDSPSHAVDFVIAKHSPQYHQASLETSGGDLGRDVVISLKTQRPRTGLDLIASKAAGDDGYFMLTLTPGQELAELSQGMDYVFILDVSGSMANDGKLSFSQRSLGAFLEGLSPEDRFEVMTFNVAVTTLFRELKAADEAGVKQAREFLKSQVARGGTILRPAITAAYNYHNSDRVLNVVILSDGMTEQNEQAELMRLIGQRPAGSRVFCIGVGNEVNRPLMQQLADQAGGLAAFLSPEDRLDRQAEAFRRKLMRPALTNVRLSFAGGGVDGVEPATIPNLYHGSPAHIYGRYSKPGKMEVTFNAEIMGKAFQQTTSLQLPDKDATNPEIERMWAWRRVERLFEEERTAGSPKHQNEIVKLCEGYSIASQYASFLVLENDAEFQRWKIQRRNVTRIKEEVVAQAAIRQKLEKLRDQAAAEQARAVPEPAKETTAAANSNQPASSGATPPSFPASNGSPAPDATPSPTFRSPTPANFGGGGGGGGGAIDPLSAAIAAGLAGAAWAASRRKSKGA
jgi:Ca-activated chloride channel family protein